MPNWSFNTITCNNPEVIKRCVSETKEDGKFFDFNRLLPMPESLNIESGSVTDEAITVFVTKKLTVPAKQTNLSSLIHNMFSTDWASEMESRVKEKSAEELQMLYEKGKQYMFNKEHYGFFTWYDWCWANWGTKWNACDSCFNEDFTEVRFDTAWNLPEPIFRELCRLFPDEEINFYSESEEGYCYELENNNGDLSLVNSHYAYDDEEDEEAE